MRCFLKILLTIKIKSRKYYCSLCLSIFDQKTTEKRRNFMKKNTLLLGAQSKVNDYRVGPLVLFISDSNS